MSVNSPGPLKFHELADLFPLMAEAEQDALGADMEKNGTLDRIVMLHGEILDGRNRYCQIVLRHLDPPSADWRGDKRFVDFAEVSNGLSPLDWVLSKNLARRHLTEGQRAMIAAHLATMRQGRPVLRQTQDEAADDKPANLPVLESAPLSQAEAAGVLHVSERSVRSARRVIESGAPELVDAVESGALAVSAAEAIAALPVEDQAALIRQADPKAFARVAKEKRAEKQAEKKSRRDDRQKAMGKANLAAGERKFPVIYADPEWKFEAWSDETGMDRAAENHYPTSDLDAITSRPVGDIAADDCVLFLWATAPMVTQALDVMAAWGFAYKAHTIWRKADIEARGGAPEKVDRGRYSTSLVLGTGYWFRNAHELLLVGTRGKVPAPAMGTQFPSVIDAAPLKHSQKPARFAELIEAYFPDAPKIELNRRGVPRDGWWAWGNEVAGDMARGIVVDENGFADASHLPLLSRAPVAAQSPAADGVPPLPGTAAGASSATFVGPDTGAAGEASSLAAPAPSKTRGKKAMAKPALPAAREIEADGVRAIVRFGENTIQFYAIDRDPFPAEIGMVEIPRGRVGQLVEMYEGDDDQLWSDVFGAVLGDEKDRRIPTTIYRLGRTGPVPVRGDAS